jgi:hypothetical protein
MDGQSSRDREQLPAGTDSVRILGDSEPIAEAVVKVVSGAADCDPLELPPLDRTIDTDALNTLLRDRARTGPVMLQFQYAGFEVSTDGSTVAVTELGQDELS